MELFDIFDALSLDSRPRVFIASVSLWAMRSLFQSELETSYDKNRAMHSTKGRANIVGGCYPRRSRQWGRQSKARG